MWYEILTREMHTKKKYSLVGVECLESEELPVKGTELTDGHNVVWKVVDHYEGKLVLKSKESSKHPVGHYLQG
jgi:hypothetical protein